MTSRSLFAGILWIFWTAEIGFPCTTTALYDPKTMVAAADLILRVKAVEYSGPPPTLSSRMAARFVPAANVAFLVEEVVKGKYEKFHIILPGYLNEQDEWNRKDQNPPYGTARLSADGRCFAIAKEACSCFCSGNGMDRLRLLSATRPMATHSIGFPWVL